MASITTANLILLLDKVSAAYLAALGTNASGFGLGTAGDTVRAYKKFGDLLTLVLALNDADQVLSLLSDTQQTQRNCDTLTAFAQMASRLGTALNNEARRSGNVLGLSSTITDLNSFARYYNTGAGGPWLCLFAPDFRAIYFALYGVNPDASNTYFEVLQGATYANALRKLVVGTGMTAGFDIDSTAYAGGFGQLNVSGLTGTGIVTATGDWRDVAGNVLTAQNGTVNVTANGVFVLTPPATNALLIKVTNITVPGGITAGTIYAEAKRPTGRTNPPT